MKFKVCISLLLVLVLCGNCFLYSQKERSRLQNVAVDNIYVDSKPAEDNTVQTGAKSAGVTFKNDEGSVKKSRLENDYIRVWNIRVWNKKNTKKHSKWMQENLNGTGRKEIPFAPKEVLWITNDWIYYYEIEANTNRGGKKYIICRVPVKNDNGVIYETEKREILLQVKFFLKTEFIVTDSDIIYGVSLSKALVGESITYYRYDMESKESVRIFNLGLSADLSDSPYEPMGIYYDIPSYLPIILNNSFFVSGSEGLFRVPFDTFTAEKIYSGKTLNSCIMPVDDAGLYFSHETDTLMAVDGSILYFTATGREILKYDGSSNHVSCVLPEKALRTIFENLKLWDDNPLYIPHGVIEGFRILNDRLYINVLGVWDKVPADDTDYYTAEREVLLSADLSDLRKWKLEETLSDYILNTASCNYINENADKNLEQESTDTLSRICRIYALNDGEMLISCYLREKSDWSDGVEKNVIYDIGTGEFLPIEQDDPRYCQRQWRNEFSQQWFAEQRIYSSC